MKKMNNILKMISQMDANANEVKLAKHEVELANWQEQILSMTENNNNVNLLTHDVNLSIVDDFKTYISNGKNFTKLFNELNKRISNLQKEKIDVLNKKDELYNIIYKSNSYAGKNISDYQKQSRELGLNAVDNPLYKTVLEQYDINSEYINKLDSFKI
jgi:signal recognition particle GTPase